MKNDYETMSIYELLAVYQESLLAATIMANRLTKIHKQYWTALKGANGNWYCTNRYSPFIGSIHA